MCLSGNLYGSGCKTTLLTDHTEEDTQLKFFTFSNTHDYQLWWLNQQCYTWIFPRLNSQKNLFAFCISMSKVWVNSLVMWHPSISITNSCLPKAYLVLLTHFDSCCGWNTCTVSWISRITLLCAGTPQLKKKNDSRQECQDSSIRKRTRQRWSEEERTCFFKSFGQSITNKVIPPTSQILEFISKQKSVKTVSQVQAQIHNYISGKIK